MRSRSVAARDSISASSIARNKKRTVAGVIEDRPTCDELVRQIVEEAEQTLKRLAL